MFVHSFINFQTTTHANYLAICVGCICLIDWSRKATVIFFCCLNLCFDLFVILYCCFFFRMTLQRLMKTKRTKQNKERNKNDIDCHLPINPCLWYNQRAKWHSFNNATSCCSFISSGLRLGVLLRMNVLANSSVFGHRDLYTRYVFVFSVSAAHRHILFPHCHFTLDSFINTDFEYTRANTNENHKQLIAYGQRNTKTVWPNAARFTISFTLLPFFRKLYVGMNFHTPSMF